MKSKLNSLITAIVLFITLVLETGCHSVSSPSDNHPLKTAPEEKIDTPQQTTAPVKPATEEKTPPLSKSAESVTMVTAEKTLTLQQSAGKFVPVVQSVPTGLAVNAMAYNHDGQLLAISYQDNVIRLFKVVDDRFYLLRVFVGHTDKVTAIDFEPQGQYLTSYSDDDTTKSWEVKTGQLLPNVIEPKQEIEIEIEEANSFYDEKPPIIAIDSRERYRASGRRVGKRLFVCPPFMPLTSITQFASLPMWDVSLTKTSLINTPG